MPRAAKTVILILHRPQRTTTAG